MNAGAEATPSFPPPGGPRYVSVAVPLPLAGPLTYQVPEDWRAPLVPGCRVRVPVGRRQVTGVLLAVGAELPAGIVVRALGAPVDLSPLLPADLLELAAFTADYYLAPIGEVLRVFFPRSLDSHGSQRVEITARGAITRPHDPTDAAILAALLENAGDSVAALHRRLPVPDLAARLERLAESEFVRLGAAPRRRSSARYVAAVELVARSRDQLHSACGRSAPARAVVDHLLALGRPAKVSELLGALGCSRAVIDRLARLRVVRRFTQVERLSLERHVLAARVRPPVVLRAEQEQALEPVLAALQARRFAGFLLHGATGSGKTEVYLRALTRCLELGRSAIVMVPEIALVPALARDLRERFGDRLAILHSALADGERAQEWQRLQAGQSRVVLGPRSAVFAPVHDLGLVVVDEEHDSAYKQETSPRYHGRDLALVRAQRAGAAVLLVSATPSLESRSNAARGRHALLALAARSGSAGRPEHLVVDLRREPVPRTPGEVVLSPALQDALRETLASGGQAIVLRNRRGYAPLLLCRACGEDHRCTDCGLPMTWHRRTDALVCHYCGARRATPRVCGACSSTALEPIGAGTERVEERLRALFPDINIDVLDRDAVARPGGAAAVLERFGEGQSKVLLGTQMVAKGHHFPEVALAAVLAADSYLGFPDFRAVEKTYSLLVQLAGRAGRGDRPGRVLLQTYNPDHYALRAVVSGDDQAFAEHELNFRRAFLYPPFARMVQVVVRDPQRARGEERLRRIAQRVFEHPLGRTIRVGGPAPAPIERLRGAWRFQLLLRGRSATDLRRLLHQAVLPEANRDTTIDVDPCDLL